MRLWVDSYRIPIEDGMGQKRTDLLRGTLDLLVLKALSLEPLHGVGISRRITQITKGAYRVSFGSLFPVLHRMEESGWVEAEWRSSDNNRRAKYYRLTSAGRAQLKDEERHTVYASNSEIAGLDGYSAIGDTSSWRLTDCRRTWCLSRRNPRNLESNWWTRRAVIWGLGVEGEGCRRKERIDHIAARDGEWRLTKSNAIRL
jgi:PadR family transcriptional regulator